MGRPLKNGLEYFPLDTDVLENRKVQRLLRKYGCEGFAIYSAILCDIYRREGYYVRYDATYCQDIAFVLNLPEENPGLVGEVIGYCICLGLFDADLAARESILTSAGIQMRYREVRKRYKAPMRNDFLLLSGTETPAELPDKAAGSEARVEMEKGASFRSAGPCSVSAAELSPDVTESGAGSPVTGTGETTEAPLYGAETGRVPEQECGRTKTEPAVPVAGTGETGEQPAAASASIPAGATNSGAYGDVTGVAAAKSPVRAATNPVDATESGGCVAEAPVCLTEPPVHVAEQLSVGIPDPPDSVTKPRVYVTETPLCVTETPVCVTETPTKEKENKKERKEKIEERVVGYYNFRLSGKLPPVVKLTHGRIRAVLARVAEYGEAGVMGMLDAAAASPFLLGENPRRWRADFDWLFKPANFVKVWEGNYVNSHGNETHSGGNSRGGERKRAILRMAAEAASRDRTA